MSQYTAKYTGRLSAGQCYAGAEMAYYHPDYPWPKEQFTLQEYQRLVAEDASGGDGIVAYDTQGQLQGVVSITPMIRDPHMPGLGVWVTQIIAAHEHPKVGACMYRALIQLLRRNGGSWFRIGKRLSATTILDEYRRVP